MRTSPRVIVFIGIVALVAACSRERTPPAVEQKASGPTVANPAPTVPTNSMKEAYFGAFHVHTRYSFDGFTNGSVTTPDDAYRWAKGEAIPGGGGGGDLKIKEPLDWYMVSDHAEYLGVFPKFEDPNSPLSQLDIAKRATSKDQKVAFDAFAEILKGMSAGKPVKELADPAIGATVWKEIIATADKHNDPGKFTTFIGFEWTSNPGQRNLHRVVVFENSNKVPDLPFSSMDSDKEEDLWNWMDTQRASGASLLAIPHNGNASDGLMFAVEKSYGGSALTKEYAETRMRNEPVYEITQIKGTSETSPRLSPNDEFAGFELWDYMLSADAARPKNHVGGYARDAFLRGLKLDASGNGNPFKYGVIGDSDTHNSAAAVEEDNFTGKFARENDPKHRLEGFPGFKDKNKQQLREFSSGGLAGVWAESNTRGAIFAAVKRKETFATSGTRMKVRVFAGFDFKPNALDSDSWLKDAYAGGVPMGGDLRPNAGGKAPTLLIKAIKEVDGANLDRIQVIKGWVSEGKTQEKIYDVAASGDRKPDEKGRLPPVGNTVDVKAATYTNEIGAPQLSAVWTDPEFDPAAHAFYYVRVLQIPTPRWSTYDAQTLGVAPRKDLPASIQERAWSSPIWYTP